MSIEDHPTKVIYTYMGTAFVLEPYSDGYRICGMDLASDEIWFPDSFGGKRIVPWVSLNQCSNPNMPWFHHFDTVRRLHIPNWMRCLDAHNYLFPNLEAIDIHPSPAHPMMTSLGPLLIHNTVLMRVFSAGYMESFTFPREIKCIGDSAFAYTTITDIHFESTFIEFHKNAFGGSRINRLIQNGEKQFIIFGNLLYRCVYADSKKLTIPAHIRSFEKDAFKEIYIQRPDGSKDWTNLDFIEEIESPVPIKSYQPFNGVKKYYVHSFSKAALENLWRIFPNMAWFEIMGLEHSPDYVTQQGVLFTKDMKTLVIYPKHQREEYTVPATVETIQSGAFKDNSYLKIVHLSESLRIIGSSAFERSNLEFIKLPKSIERIGSYAFDSCKLKVLIITAFQVSIVTKVAQRVYLMLSNAHIQRCLGMLIFISRVQTAKASDYSFRVAPQTAIWICWNRHGETPVLMSVHTKSAMQKWEMLSTDIGLHLKIIKSVEKNRFVQGISSEYHPNFHKS